jgi:hypothetical protein
MEDLARKEDRSELEAKLAHYLTEWRCSYRAYVHWRAVAEERLKVSDA